MRCARMIGIAGVLGGLLVLCSCQMGTLVSAGTQRVTFALVIDTRTYNGKAVVADVLDDVGGVLIETVSAVLESYPNTAHQAWARLTTLEQIDTNRRYFLDFFIDIDDSGGETSGDLAGIQHFDVMPNAVWSETKYFASELELLF